VKTHEGHVKMSLNEEEMFEWLKKNFGEELDTSGKALVLYGSETGNAEEMANNLAHELKRRAQKVKISAMNDFDINDVANMNTV